MKIKIDIKNVNSITDAIAAVNGKAEAHTAGHRDIYDLAEYMDTKLSSLGIPKKDWVGAIAHGMSGGSVPSAYKYKRNVSRYKIERRSSGWFFTMYHRTDIYGDASAPRLSLTPAQRDIALAKFSKQFAVQGV